MIGESIEFQDHQENISTNTSESRNMELAENASEINACDSDNFQSNQQYAEVLSSNKNSSNKLQSSALDIGSDVTLEQKAPQNVASFGNESPRLEHSKVPIYSKEYGQTSNQQCQEEMMPMQENIKRINEYSTTATPIYRPNPVCAESANSNSTFGNYKLYAGSCSAEHNPNVQQQEQEQQSNMQTEGINSVLAHQWRQRREKLPITPVDPTFYTEWQINQPEVVNTAEIQKQKLLFFQRKADEQLAPVNQQNLSSTTETVKNLKRKLKQKQQQQPQPCNPQEQQQQQQQQQPQPCNSQEQQQQQQQQQQPQPCNFQQQQQQQQQQQLHQTQHFYRLHQMQQEQNHLRSPTLDSLSSLQQFAYSPISLNSPTVAAGQLSPQMLPYIQSALSQQIQMQQAVQPNNVNPNYNFPMIPQQQQQQQQQAQQQLMLQMLQPQPLQQQLMQYYQSTVGPDFLEKRQQLNQQKYHEALQENAVRHKGTTSSGQLSMKRKRQNVSLKIGDDKESASVNSSESQLFIDDSIAEPSNVPDKYNEDLGPKPNPEESKSVLQSIPSQSGMWQNNYSMIQDWLQMQMQETDQKESDIVQSRNAE